MLLTDDAAKRAALDRLERQALNPGTLHGVSAGPGLAGETRPHRRCPHGNRTAPGWGRVPYDFLRLSPDFKALATNDRYRRALAMARAQFDDTVALLREADGDRSSRRSCSSR